MFNETIFLGEVAGKNSFEMVQYMSVEVFLISTVLFLIPFMVMILIAVCIDIQISKMKFLAIFIWPLLLQLTIILLTFTGYLPYYTAYLLRFFG